MEKDRLPSLPVRVALVFFAPGRLFDSLRERPAWIGALATMAVLSGLATGSISLEAWESMMAQRLLEAGQEATPGLPAGDVFRAIAGAGAFLTTFVFAGVLSSLIVVVFAFGLGDQGRFVQYLAVVAHGGLIQAVGAWAVLPLRNATLNPELTLNLGTFLPFLTDGYASTVLRLLDLFGLWALVVLALGVSRIDPRRSWGTATLLLVGLNLAFVLVIGAFVQ